MSKLWEFYGSKDPYYGVLSVPEFRAERMDADAKTRFFDSGVTSIDMYVALAEKTFGPLRFDTALDYGCGAGRLSKALASRFKRVISVDISESMLAVARSNMPGLNVTYENAQKMGTDTVDFCLSQMVFQHIPPEEGMRVLPQLARRLRGTGIVEAPIADKASAAWRLLSWGKKTLNAVLPARPTIPMYVYDERELVRALEKEGCTVQVSHFDTERFVQAQLVFRR